MKVYLDDIRPTPDGWVRCWWPSEVIELLKTGNVEVLSLDHDLGNDDRGTGYDVLAWIEQEVHINGFVPPQLILIHSANTVARERMQAAIALIRRASEKYSK